MNAIERIVQDDLDRLIDRLATSTHEGMLAECLQQDPELVTRLEDAETKLTAARQDLLKTYGAWRDALDECGDLWGLAELAAGRPRLEELRAA